MIDTAMVRHRRLLLAATAALSLVYLYLGTRPQAPAPIAGIPDTFVHLGGYLALAVMVAVTARAWAAARPGTVAFAFTVGHGALLEALQLYSPPRQAELKDLAVDAVAAALGVGLVAWRRW